MISAKHCRDQSAECVRLMELAQSRTEARILRDLAQSWTRIANQTERYATFVKSLRSMATKEGSFQYHSGPGAA